MEKLPRGANFQRTKLLWEIGLHIAGDPGTPYYGNRDMCITVGSGSGENFRPWLRMATGAPHLAYAVCRGDLEMAMVILQVFSPRPIVGPVCSLSRCRSACLPIILHGIASYMQFTRAPA